MLAVRSFFIFPSAYLEKLARDLDLVGQQGEPLIAQALDFLHRDVGVQQILVAARALRGFDFL